MISRIAVLILTLFFTQVYCQNDSSFFFKEFTISINRTNLKDSNTEGRFGFGVGIYGYFLNKKKVNVIFGFELNLKP